MCNHRCEFSFSDHINSMTKVFPLSTQTFSETKGVFPVRETHVYICQEQARLSGLCLYVS